MKAKPKAKNPRDRDLLVGSWFNADEYATEVEFIIKRAKETYLVRARDRYDNEEADISETAWDGTVLSFAAYWNSTGRFGRYRIMLLSPNRISLTYTYTDKEMYHRKPKRKSG